MRYPQIEEIHTRGERGVFVELGCGSPVAHRLLSVQGASNTVEESHVLYSKESQERAFRSLCVDAPGRSVSREAVCLLAEGFRAETPGVTFGFASSFQVFTYSEDGKVTHGWMSYMGDSVSMAVHVTLPQAVGDRFDKIELIGRIGVDIVACRGNLAELEFNCFIDDVIYDGSTHKTAIYDLLEVHSKPSYRGMGVYDHVVMFKNGKAVRPERTLGDDWQIYKGSFNPPHRMHTRMAEDATLTTKVETTFAISTDTFDKGSIGLDDLTERVCRINAMGRSVLIFKSALFNTNTMFLRQRGHRGDISWVMGGDTVERYDDAGIELEWDQDESYKTYVIAFSREGSRLVKHRQVYYVPYIDDNISSTEVRTAIADLRKMVPAKVLARIFNGK